MAGYDTVFLCYPNYWGTMPMAVFTFLEQFDFSGKTIRPLCTNEGSGLGSSPADIRRLCPDAVLTPGLAVTGGQADKATERQKMDRRCRTSGRSSVLPRRQSGPDPQRAKTRRRVINV